MLLKIFTFFTLIFLSRTSRVPFTQNNDYVYDYNGKITTTLSIPDFYSYHSIKAKLHVSPLEDGLWLELKDVEYEVYSGDSIRDDASKDKIPKDSESINIPFIYHRYQNESQYGITVHKDDKIWSRNMKQGIANAIFMNSRALNANKLSTQFVHEDQHTYHILPFELKNNTGIIVEKFKKQEYYDMALEPKFKYHKEEDDMLPIIKKQTYLFLEQDELVLKGMYYEANFDFYPFKGQSEKFYTLVKQELEQTSTIPLSEPPKVNRDNMEYVEIDFEPKMFMKGGGTYDFTMGRQPIDLDALTLSIKSDLNSIVQNFHDSHITLSKVYLESKHSVGFLIHRLRNLDTTHLSHLYSSISNLSDNKMVNVLLQAMSLTGTPTPYFFIMDLMSEAKISENLSVQLLENMPKHVTQYYPKLVKRLWIFIEDKPANIKVRYTAVLSLSSILYWSKCSDKIIDVLIEILTKAEDDQQRILFINALRNINCKTTDLALLKIAKDDSITSHVRSIAMMAFKKGEHHDFLWLKLFDSSVDYEMRVMALHLLTDPQYPDHYDKIYLYLSSDGDEYMKHFFYKKCESISTTTIVHHEETSTRARELLPKMKWTSKSEFIDANYFFDYTDSSFEFGASALVTYYGNFMKTGFLSFHFQHLQQSTSPIWSQNEHYFHLRCPPEKTKEVRAALNIMNYVSLDVLDECIFDHITVRNYDVISYNFFKGINDTMQIELMEIIAKLGTPHIDIDQPLNTEIIIPTDMGLPLIFFNQKSHIKETHVKFDTTQNHLALKMKYSGNEIYAFTTYNPISNSWHGIRRVHMSDTYIPVNMNIIKGHKSIEMKINREEDAFGFQSYVYNHVFIHSANDDDSIIKKSCPKCEQHSVIADGDESVENHVLWENDGENTGLDYKLAIFDCEDHITASDSRQIKQTIQTMLDDENKNFDSFPAVKPILAIHNLWTSIILSPTNGMCGMGLMMKKSKNNPATHIDFSMLMEQNATYSDLSQFRVADFQFTYYLKNDDTLLKSWDINLVYNIIKNSEYLVKMNAKSTKPGKPDYRVCMDVLDKWGHNHWTSDWNILMGNDVDGQCPTEESKIKITMNGEMNEELKEMKKNLGTVFDECDNTNELNLRDCIRDISSYRFYDIDVTYEKLPKECKQLWITFSDFLKLTNSDEFVRMEHREDLAKSGHMKITMNYPYKYNTVNVSVVTPIESYRFDDVGYGYYTWFPYVHPYSAFMMYNDDLLNYCEVSQDYVKHSEGGLKNDLKYEEDGWSKLVSTCPIEESECSGRYKIKMKKSTESDSDQIMLHIQFDNEIFEVSYVENNLEILLNGKKMPVEFEERYHHEEWIDYMVLPDKEKSYILVHLNGIGLTAYFNSEIVKMVLVSPLSENTIVEGQCKTEE